MAIKIKVITGTDFLEVTADGVIDLATSRRLLVEIARAEQPPVDHELLVDFRDTQNDLSILDVYQLSAELVNHGDTFRRKAALLVLPGINFDHATFFETCAHNRGFAVHAFTDYEKAIRWLLSAEELPDDNVPPDKAEASGVG
jgi:hypothetical protein